MTRLTVPLRALAVFAFLAAPARAQVCLESFAPLDARNGAQGVLCVDLDQDGHPDVVTANWGIGPGALRVFRGLGSGSFSVPVAYVAGLDPRLIRSADLNGDGYPDLVVASSGWGYLSVFLNQGDGTLAPRVDYDLGIGDADGVACADFDGDGDIDVACGNTYSPGWLKIFRNLGDGSFAANPTSISNPAAIDLVAADFDGDGDADLAALSSPTAIRVFINLGGGSFASAVPYYLSVYDVYQLVCADLDGDGDPDLAALGSSYPHAVVDVLLNMGAGVFGGVTAYEFGSYSDPNQLTAADLDGDTHPELIATGGGKLHVFGNQGAGTFSPQEPQATAGGAYATGAADLDGDGRTDLAVAGNVQLWMMHNEGDWRFSGPPRISVPRPPVQTVSADLDRDGDADLAVIEHTPWGDPLGSVRILRNNGVGGFSLTASCPVGRCPAAIRATDLDGDGALDLVVANDGYSFPGPTGSVSVLLNHGDGTFAPEIRSTLDTYPTAVASADFDHDGDEDVVLLDIGPAYLGSISILLNDGHGALAAPTRYAVGKNPSELEIADLDGDGELDIVALNLGQNSLDNDISILGNQGNGTFAPAVTLAAGLFPRSLACADVDGDGDADLVLGGQRLNVLLNTGAGTFGAPHVHTLYTGTGRIEPCDVDGDGALDLFVSRGWLNTISVLANAGGGWFTMAGEYAAGWYPERLCVDDLDGDGDLDVACTAWDGITILRNCASQGLAFCPGDGNAGACPCNNNGLSGRGCDNSAATGGAILSATGFASLANDTLMLRSSGELPSAVSVVLQGTLRYPAMSFGDGLRCVSGVLKRLYIRPAVGGVLVVPQQGDPSISARSAAMGDSIQAGSTRLYQVYYRDPDLGFCPAPQGNSWNISSGLSVRWLQ